MFLNSISVNKKNTLRVIEASCTIEIAIIYPPILRPQLQKR